MSKVRIIALAVLIIGGLLGYFVFASEKPESRFPFKYGLDLNGGTHLIYQADISKLGDKDIKSSMQALRDVIEIRVNAFGVSEPLVQVEESNIEGGRVHKLV